MISLSSTISRVVFASLLFASALGVSHREQDDMSALLGRLNDLESKVEALKDEVVALTTELQSQNELIMSLEALVTRSRFLADDECLFTFANETGTPTCSVAYQLIAESGLEVVGDATFETAQFTGSVVAEDTVEFLANVTFQDDANMTFNGPTVFNNLTSFNELSTFDADAEFNSEVSFYEDVFFEDGADVSFEDTVVFFDDVTIDGPSSGSIIFDIKDRVDVRFRQSRDLIVETATSFYKNVRMIQKPCSGNRCSNDVPTLLVAGDITGESDLIVEGELQADATDFTVRSLTASNTIVSQGAIIASTNITVSGFIEATGDIIAAGLMKGDSIESTSTIIAAGDITSTSGVVSPFDLTLLTNEDITVNSLTAATTIVSQGTITASSDITSSGAIAATGDITTDGNFVDTTP